MSDKEELVIEFIKPIEVKEPVYEHTALGIYKDKAKGLWQVVRVGFNADGSTGGMKIMYESGFRDEANEWFRITVAKSGMLG